jgi:predicted RNA-binding protein with RPS1 domain
MSPEQREQRRKERLDQTTPEFRALMDQFRKDMNQRRQQRGLAMRGGR